MTVETTSVQQSDGRARLAQRTSSRSVGQTLDVLELLASAEGPLGVTEIAQSLGLSAPGTHRLLVALHERGYVARDKVSATKYTRGLACFRLAALAASRQSLRSTAAEHLQALNGATREAVHLAVHEAGQVVYIDKLESLHEIAPVSRIGGFAPAHCVATGRAILAYLPREELDALLERGLERHTAETITDPDELLGELEVTRRRGYAVNRGAWRAGVGGVAAPIRDFSGAVLASVGCCMPLERLTRATLPVLAARTTETAAAISADLGFVVPESPLAASAPRGRSS